MIHVETRKKKGMYFFLFFFPVSPNEDDVTLFFQLLVSPRIEIAPPRVLAWVHVFFLLKNGQGILSQQTVPQPCCHSDLFCPRAHTHLRVYPAGAVRNCPVAYWWRPSLGTAMWLSSTMRLQRPTSPSNLPGTFSSTEPVSSSCRQPG